MSNNMHVVRFAGHAPLIELTDGLGLLRAHPPGNNFSTKITLAFHR